MVFCCQTYGGPNSDPPAISNGVMQEKISIDSPFWKAKFNIRSVNAPPRPYTHEKTRRIGRFGSSFADFHSAP